MKNVKIFAVFATVLVMVQCQDDGVQNEQQETAPIPVAIIEGLNAMGLDTETKEVIATEKGYLVEGDMIIDAETILNPALKSAKHERLNNIVSCRNARDITVYNGIPSINDEVISAINDWNSVFNSDLKLRLISRDRADITISFDARNLGSATLPGNGRPGSDIFMDPALYNSLDEPQRSLVLTFVIKHEIGHTIGFFHTNENFIRILGTPAREAASVMNSQPPGVENFQSNNLTTGDRRALTLLYGRNGAPSICE